MVAENAERPFGVGATREAYANALQAYLLACREYKDGRGTKRMVEETDATCERAARDYADALQGLRPVSQREFVEIAPEAAPKS